jgi:hypothetical protein
VLLTASGVMRGNKKIDLKAIADSGLEMCEKQGEVIRQKPAPQAAVGFRLGFRAASLRRQRSTHTRSLCKRNVCASLRT